MMISSVNSVYTTTRGKDVTVVTTLPTVGSAHPIVFSQCEHKARMIAEKNVTLSKTTQRFAI
jgi:hypothetical protein